jgi:hypothetical protein
MKRFASAVGFFSATIVAVALSADFARASPPAPSGCTTVGSTRGLTAGQSFKSCDGRFQLSMQTDGNLVLYMGDRALWATGTKGKGGAVAVMQGDGNLVVYDRRNKALWASGTNGHSGATLAVQNDGNLVVYGPGQHPVWASNTVQPSPSRAPAAPTASPKKLDDSPPELQNGGDNGPQADGPGLPPPPDPSVNDGLPVPPPPPPPPPPSDPLITWYDVKMFLGWLEAWVQRNDPIPHDPPEPQPNDCGGCGREEVVRHMHAMADQWATSAKTPPVAIAAIHRTIDWWAASEAKNPAGITSHVTGGVHHTAVAAMRKMIDGWAASKNETTKGAARP